MTKEDVLREHLLKLLQGGNAHMSFDNAIENFPIEMINERAPNVEYTPWHLLEHIRIAQWDILDFVRNATHISPKWPDGYWPTADQTAEGQKWQETIDGFRSDMKDLQAIATDQSIDLVAPIPHAPDYTVLRELLLVADHNAYHIGEFAILRQVMGTWPSKR